MVGPPCASSAHPKDSPSLQRERRLLKEDGTPNQMNTAKWPFALDDDGENVTVDLALPKFLDSAAVRRAGADR